MRAEKVIREVDADKEQPILRALGVTVEAPKAEGPPDKVVDDLTLELSEGKVLGIVGQSGAGKTVVTQALINLLPRGLRISSGQIMFRGMDLLELSPDKLRALRGRRIALISEDAKSRLHPTVSTGDQVANVFKQHFPDQASDSVDQVTEGFARVGLPDPHLLYHSYPHELSGGMAQRVMIAMALICSPDVILADNPTFGLDVTIQLQILELIRGLVEDENLALLIATHDLGIVAQFCNELAILQHGKVIERGVPRQVLRRPKTDYAQRLMKATKEGDPHPSSKLESIDAISSATGTGPQNG